MRHFLPLLALLAVTACAGTPMTERLAGNSDRACGGSVLDEPGLARRLMAATFAEGPRGVSAAVFACRTLFRTL